MFVLFYDMTEVFSVYNVLNYLAAGYLVCYLVLTFMRAEINVWRLLCAGAFAAFGGVIYPHLSVGYNYVFIVAAGLAMLLVMKETYTLKEFVFAVSVTALTAAVTFCGTEIIMNYVGNEETVLPFAVCGGLLSALTLIRLIIYLTKDKLSGKARYTYKVEMFYNGKSVVADAYYDSGNKLYDNDEPVIVISSELSTRLALATNGNLPVSTVGGIKLLPKTKVEYRIYSEDGANKIYRSAAIISPHICGRGYQVILHKDSDLGG